MQGYSVIGIPLRRIQDYHAPYLLEINNQTALTNFLSFDYFDEESMTFKFVKAEFAQVGIFFADRIPSL